ncbi:MAG: glutamate mutase L [Bdellovibrionales bacterium]|nr:glutamate mutase L [Bdellovibrionales bacterium]
MKDQPESTMPDRASLSVVLATDCGSTTTKAILFEKTPDGWRQTYRGEAPTTVEKPVADVTIGAMNAFSELEDISGRKLLQPGSAENTCPILARTAEHPEHGVDLYVSTSSAGGGLQMIVAGIVSGMTTESAERAALGAGAIVMDAISIDDGREQYERVEKIRHLRPDIILLAGGVEGGNADLPLELAETILTADPRPRFGETLRLPVIYAANSAAREEARQVLEKHFSFTAVDNLRPTLNVEQLAPARDAIHELFLNHVMSHAPGYRKLLSWSPVPIIPTPAAVGDMVVTAARERSLQIVAVDIGGATTDVFSVFRNPDAEDEAPVFNRTVSANLGMSYSVANVLLEAGEEQIRRWLPFELNADELRDRLRNKMIRPTSIPQTMPDLILEQAVCREALRLAFEHHKRLAVGLRGKQRGRVSVSDVFRQQAGGESLVDMLGLNLIIGSGGVLSHAPNRRSSAFMLLDSYEPLGVTELAVDSIFMMPHLGVFSTVHPEAATEIFFRDCLVPLGTAIAPSTSLRPGQRLFDVELDDGRHLSVNQGALVVAPLTAEHPVHAVVKPASRQIDVGAGPGKAFECEIRGGEAGLILDGRGRPLTFPLDPDERSRAVAQWYDAFSLSVEVA